MAYIVMAHIVMTYIVMAYIVMAHIVMASIVMTYIVMAYTIGTWPYISELLAWYCQGQLCLECVEGEQEKMMQSLMLFIAALDLGPRRLWIDGALGLA